MPLAILKRVVNETMDIANADELFQSLADSSPIGIFIAQKGRFQFVNQRFQRQSGYPREELIGTDPLDIIVPEDRAMVRERAISMLKGQTSSPYEYRIVTKGGEVRWIVETVASVQYNGQKAALGYFMDVTLRKRAEEALRESEMRHRTLVETSPDAIVFLDADGTILMCNQRTAALYGIERAEDLVGRNTCEFIAPEDHQRVLRNRASVFEAAKVTAVRYTGMKNDGTRFPVETSVSMLPGVDGKPPRLIAIVRDNTERDHWEQQLAYLASHDPLTGLSNRRALEEASARTVARARRGTPSALLCMDLDNFKLINDTLGHAAGDRALIALTQVVQSTLRAGDLLARIGGDEFAVLLEGTDVEGAQAAAERIRFAVEHFSLAIDGRDFPMGLSIGMVAIDGQQDPSEVLSAADTAMYAAKQGGGNRVCFHQLDLQPSA